MVFAVGTSEGVVLRIGEADRLTPMPASEARSLARSLIAAAERAEAFALVGKRVRRSDFPEAALGVVLECDDGASVLVRWDDAKEPWWEGRWNLEIAE